MNKTGGALETERLLRFLSVNAKQLERSVFQAEPSRCKSGDGDHFMYDLGFRIYETVAEAARKS